MQDLQRFLLELINTHICTLRDKYAYPGVKSLKNDHKDMKSYEYVIG